MAKNAWFYALTIKVLSPLPVRNRYTLGLLGLLCNMNPRTVRLFLYFALSLFFSYIYKN